MIPLYYSLWIDYNSKGIEVDKANIDVIANMPTPTIGKGVRSFLGHVGFYRWFIKDFSNKLKMLLTTAPIIAAPDWYFRIGVDASYYAIRAVLEQQKDKFPQVI